MLPHLPNFCNPSNMKQRGKEGDRKGKNKEDILERSEIKRDNYG